MVTETFLHSGNSNGLLDPKHLYTINYVRTVRSSGKGGGVCSFVNQNILTCQLPLSEIYADLEMLCFDFVNRVPPGASQVLFSLQASLLCSIYAFSR